MNRWLAFSWWSVMSSKCKFKCRWGFVQNNTIYNLGQRARFTFIHSFIHSCKRVVSQLFLVQFYCWPPDVSKAPYHWPGWGGEESSFNKACFFFFFFDKAGTTTRRKKKKRKKKKPTEISSSTKMVINWVGHFPSAYKSGIILYEKKQKKLRQIACSQTR